MLSNKSPTMYRVVLLEDNIALADSIRITLTMEGFAVAVYDRVQPLLRDLPDLQFDVALLDLELPDGSGYDVCERIRKLSANPAVVIITAKTSEEDAVKGLELGADDYIRKPFGNRELVARLRTCLRTCLQNTAEPTESIRYLGLTLLPNSLQLFYGQASQELRRKEFDILSLLVKKQGRVASREEIIEFIDRGSDIFDRTIDSHVSHLRSKIRALTDGDILISAVYSLGYRLQAATDKRKE